MHVVNHFISVSVIKWKIFTSSGSEGDTVEVKLLRTNSESNSPEVTFTLTLAGTASSSDYTLTKNVVFSKGSSESLLSVALEDDIVSRTLITQESCYLHVCFFLCFFFFFNCCFCFLVCFGVGCFVGFVPVILMLVCVCVCVCVCVFMFLGGVFLIGF